MSMHQEQWDALGARFVKFGQFILAHPIPFAIAAGVVACLWLGYHLHK